MIINDCQLNEMFENYSKYLKTIVAANSMGDDTIDAFQMSSVLAILLGSDKMTIMEKYIQWINTYER